MAEPTPDALTAAYMRQSAGIRSRTLSYAAAVWDGSRELRDDDGERISSRGTPAVQGGHLQAATLTNAFVRSLATMDGQRVSAMPGVDRDRILGYRGVPATEVYRRPAITTYSALADGKSFDAARAVGRSRLLSLAASDLQQARSRQSRDAYTATGFEYTVRVLSGNENCALCVIASTQRYIIGELQPLHPGCDCGERGVRAGYDPGVVVDRDVLEQTHSDIWDQIRQQDFNARDLGVGKTDAKGRRISDFTDLIVSREHGELGPVLTWRKDHFTGPEDLT